MDISYGWILRKSAKFAQWVRYHWVLSLPFERMKHLKTNCFKHIYIYIDPSKADTCCEVTKWIHSII